MSLEENRNNVELKELWQNVIEAGQNFEKLPETFDEITKSAKLKLKIKIENLKKNTQYESKSTDEEKAKIDAWYDSAIS